MVSVIKEQQVSRRGSTSPDERRSRLRILDAQTERAVVERATSGTDFPDPGSSAVLTRQSTRRRRSPVILPGPGSGAADTAVFGKKADPAPKRRDASGWLLLPRSSDPGLIALVSVCVLGVLLLFGLGASDSGAAYPDLLPPDSAGSRLLQEATQDWALGFRERSVPAALAAPASYQAISFQTYSVASGDTLSGIAQDHNIRLGTLVSLNGISDARRLAVGSELRIPDRDGLFHVVRRGESLGLIARRYGITVNALLDANDLESMTIFIGQQLFVPEARMDGFELDLILGRAFVYPARGVFTSGFGNRIDPFTGDWRFHNGIDIASRVGTPILAANSGRVVHIELQLGNYGRLIIIEHGSGYQTLYAHLDRFAVEVGQRVERGQVIGYMGNTGRSTGPHLHFAIVQNGRFVDPMSYFANR